MYVIALNQHTRTSFYILLKITLGSRVCQPDCSHACTPACLQTFHHAMILTRQPQNARLPDQISKRLFIYNLQLQQRVSNLSVVFFLYFKI